uniref:Pseudouridylate synthase PUS7L n=1 Tax=Callorhinchus milii TaxID=7868 RepID=V9KIS3_CALMI
MEEELRLSDGSVSAPSTCWLNPHTGFFGTIKNSPSDFVVTEISLCGCMVSDVHSESCRGAEETDQEPCVPFRKRLKKAEEIWDNVGSVESSSGCLSLGGSEGLEDSCSEATGCNSPGSVFRSVKLAPGGALDSFLDVAVADSLERFARLVEALITQEEGDGEGTVFSLGVFPDKSHRADIHRAVRQKYPFLKTLTIGAEILVKPDGNYSGLSRLLSRREAGDFLRFLDSRDKNSTFTFSPDGSKDHRKAVHHFVSKRFGKMVEAKSFPERGGDGGHQRAAITVRFRERFAFSKKRSADDCPEAPATYTAFTLRKENTETLDAIGILAAELGVVPSDFSYAGIKDKKAVSFQTVVVKNVTPRRLDVKKARLQSKGLKVYNIRLAPQHLRLGQLWGNHFNIVVRGVRKHQGDDPEASLSDRVLEAIHNVKEKGFVNFYGLQRFGLGQNVQADQIGLALLKEHLVQAVHLFFTPEEGNNPVNKAKRHFLLTGDVKATLALMPDYKTRERLMLRALNRYGTDQEGCAQAWLSIPHSMRLLYIHSYCSKVWNQAVSYRVKTYGLRPVEGDLVIAESAEASSSQNDRVHVVTAEDQKANLYSIDQIVLPMPGNSTQYPSNQLDQWYQETLARDGLKTCKFRLPALHLNIPGCYRRLLAHPQHLAWQWLGDGDVAPVSRECHPVDECGTVSDSLSLTFSLRPSCYATECLREVMKSSV